MGLDAALGLLACPRCAASLTLDGQVRCPNGHAYDVARQGYLNLSGGPPPRNADTAAMVAARADFLDAGHYAAVADEIVALVPEPSRGLLDAGAGTGWYAARLLERRPELVGIAMDVSVAAIRRAARAHPRLAAVVGDVWAKLPVRDDCLDVVLGVFAPRHPAEFARVLAAAGRLVTVTPRPEHLAELRTDLGLLDHRPDKADQLERSLGGWFRPEARRQLVESRSWGADTARASVLMGPNAFHLVPGELDAKIERLHWPRTVTVAVTTDRWRPIR